jgi:hypothetical protein
MQEDTVHRCTVSVKIGKIGTGRPTVLLPNSYLAASQTFATERRFLAVISLVILTDDPGPKRHLWDYFSPSKFGTSGGLVQVVKGAKVGGMGTRYERRERRCKETSPGICKK